MALVTHQMQASYGAFPSSSLSWTKGGKSRQCVTTVYMVKRSVRCLALKHSLKNLSVGESHVRRSNRKPFKISAFKGSSQNDESGGKSSRSKSPKNSVELSYVPHESEETIKESSEMQTMAGSPAIYNLFKNWLTMLRTQSPSHVADDILGEQPQPKEDLETQSGTQKEGKRGIWKAFWCYFLALDLTIKIPLLLFLPGYLAITAVYGADVSKELMPLWVFGPLITALYIILIRGICSLYVFSFKQTVNLVRNIPAYSLVAYTYISHGKLKEDIRARLWQPVEDIKNLDYKELSKKKMKELREWANEKFLDYVETVRPQYFRIVRFLKRANLI